MLPPLPPLSVPFIWRFTSSKCSPPLRLYLLFGDKVFPFSRTLPPLYLLSLNIYLLSSASRHYRVNWLEKLQRSGVQPSERLAPLGITGDRLWATLIPFENLSIMVSRGLREAPSMGPSLCREAWDSQFLQFGCDTSTIEMLLHLSRTTDHAVIGCPLCAACFFSSWYDIGSVPHYKEYTSDQKIFCIRRSLSNDCLWSVSASVSAFMEHSFNLLGWPSNAGIRPVRLVFASPP